MTALSELQDLASLTSPVGRVAMATGPRCADPAPRSSGPVTRVRADEVRVGWTVVSRSGFDWTVGEVFVAAGEVELRSDDGGRWWRGRADAPFEVRS